MEYTSRIYCNIPVGITKDILSMIELVGEVTQTRYAQPDLNEYLWSNELDDNFDYVDMAVDYRIDENMTYSFGAFLDKYVVKLVDDIQLLELCGELTND